MMLRVTLLTAIMIAASGFAPANNAFLKRSNSALSVAIDTSDIKNGLTVELDGEPFKVLSFSVMKQARGAAKTTIKFKNLKRGNTIENTYRSGEKFETAMIEKKAAQHTYEDENGNYFFMDSVSYEEVMVESKIVEDVKQWIDEGMECNIVFFKGDVIECVPPSPYVFEVVETEPNVKGNSASGGVTKPATLSCGAIINIPGFIDQGEKVKVDTSKGIYVERA